MKYFCFIILFSSFVFSGNEEAFSYIYKVGGWGVDEEGRGTSGWGSTIENAQPYMAFLQSFLLNKNISTVVDLGCGDWSFSKALDWGNIEYLGIDVVQDVVKRNQKLYASRNIRFICEDAESFQMPEADLLISKDVVQHLPNRDIQNIIEQFYKFKYCLITNDVHPITKSGENNDIKSGEWTTIDLSAEPFNLNGEYVFSYYVGDVLKRVFLVDNSNK